MKARNVIIVLAMALWIVSCGDEPDETGSVTYRSDRAEEIFSVEAVTMDYDKLIRSVTGSGVIGGREEVWVTSRAEGLIQEVFVSPGDFIEEGDVLLTLEDQLAYWDMKRAEQQFRSSDFEYQGVKRTFDSGAVSEIEYNRSYAAWFAAKSAYEAALRAYEDRTITAPLSGQVSRMDTSLTPGNLMRRGTSLLKIINTEQFIMTISLGQREVGLIHPGSSAEIRIDLAEGVSLGKGSVLDISGGSDGDTGAFPVRIVWPNQWDGKVKPGMTARVILETDNLSPQLIIPWESIVEREGKQWVFIARDDGGVIRAEPVEVILGKRLGNRVEVTEGLSKGDLLVLTGLSGLFPGAALNVTILDNL